jgi:hypothetical protein
MANRNLRYLAYKVLFVLALVQLKSMGIVR